MDKTCTGCKQTKPATTEFYCVASHRKSGLSPRCKECAKKYRDNNKDKSKQYFQDWYQQNRSAVIAKSKEYATEHKEEVVERQRKWRESNKEIRKIYDKQYYENHKDKAREYGKLRRIKNKEAIQAHAKAYYQSRKKPRKPRKEKDEAYFIRKKQVKQRGDRLWYAKNKDKCRTYATQYNKTHIVSAREYHRKSEEKRRAIKHNLSATLTQKQWEAIKLAFDNKCAYCGKEAKLIQEHFIALSRGGEYTHNNILPSCKSCNSRKINKDFFEWYPKQEFYSKKREQKILDFLHYKNGRQQLAFALEVDQ